MTTIGTDERNSSISNAEADCAASSRTHPQNAEKKNESSGAWLRI
jgi:hypothetical protein